MIHELTYPFTGEQLLVLKVGDKVKVSGKIVTGRDRLHEYLFNGGRSPVNLEAGAVYHCGPVVVRENKEWIVRAAGPTTSMREELFMPRIIERHKLGLIIGKGGMGPATLAACAYHGCVYLQAVGGAAQVLADRIEKVLGVYFLTEFGFAEAMWVMEVKGFPAIVTMDSSGSSLHQIVAERSRIMLSGDKRPSIESDGGRR